MSKSSEFGLRTIEIATGHSNHPSNPENKRYESVNDGINARRSGSASVLAKNEKGEVVVDRKSSASDIQIAVVKRISASSLPSIIPVGDPVKGPPLLNAEDALERTGGKGAAGAYFEHMFPIEVLADKFLTQIDFADPTKSK
eukprot:gene18013-20893_t